MARSFFAPNTGLDVLVTPKAGGPPPGPTPSNVTAVIDANSGGNVTAYTATFDANVAAGKKATLILLSTALSGTVTAAATDSAGNTWTLVKSYTVNTRRQAVYECVLTNPIVAGVTTIDLATSATGRIYVVGLTADNIGAIDTTNNGNAGTAAGFSVSSGVLPAAPGLLASVYWKAADLATTEDTANGWSRLVENVLSGAGTMTISVQVNSSTAAITHAPTWAGSFAYAQLFLFWPGA